MRRERLAALFVLGPMATISVAIALVAWAGRTGVQEPDAVVFNLTGVASSGVWTVSSVSGLNYWWKSFEPATLYVREGDEVVIKLRSADVLHRFYVPAFSVGPVDVSPGHLTTVRFRAEHRGVYQYYCTSMCGGCHFFMRGWIVVSAEGEEPVHPPPITCTLCRPRGVRLVGIDGLVALGSYLYLVYDPELNLVGKPDYLVEKGEQVIPVEVKTSRPPDVPYDSHLYELAAYCLLVQQIYGARPPYGILHYSDNSRSTLTFKVNYTLAMEQSIRKLIHEMRQREKRTDVAR